MTQVVQEYEGTHVLHRELWRVVTLNLERREAEPTGGFYADLVAMVFAAHTVEAYLNFLGQHIAPELWADERQTFRSDGVEGKFHAIFTLLELPTPDEHVRPYSTVRTLKKLRDRIAHAKPERHEQRVVGSQEDLPLFHAAPLHELVTPEAADAARADVEQFIEWLHSAAVARVDDPWFGRKALRGVLHYGTHSIRVHEG